MSRRPLRRLGAVGEAAWRLERMAPGGRLWSESPVRRHEGALRVPRAGGGGSVAAEPPDYSLLAATAGVRRHRSLAAGATSVSLLPTGDVPLSAGDVAVSFAAGHNFDWVPPAGWSTLAAGSLVYDGLDTMNYWLGWLRATGSDSYTLGVSGLSAGWSYFDGRFGESTVTTHYYTGVPASGVVVAGTPVHTSRVTSYTLAAVPPPAWAGVHRVSCHMVVRGGAPYGPTTPNYPTNSPAPVWSVGNLTSRFVTLTGMGVGGWDVTVYDWSDSGHTVPTDTQAFVDVPYGFA